VDLEDIVPFSIKFAQLKRYRYLMEGESIGCNYDKAGLTLVLLQQLQTTVCEFS
jgi:hypothetical protein